MEEIYLELGKKKVFAGTLDWPGWCRSGKDEEGAIASLLAYADRYAWALDGAGLSFDAPVNVGQLTVSERLEGNSTTDFGAPAAAPSVDEDPLGDREMLRQLVILHHCWLTFGRTIKKAQGQMLAKGPRGGGRDLGEIQDHVLEAHDAYLRKLGWKPTLDAKGSIEARIAALERADREGVAAWAAGDLPRTGPRGGSRWTARYFVRRSAWHLLDHAWEIEDRLA